jgi:ribonuclease BN (tRNA processing enzyme)
MKITFLGTCSGTEPMPNRHHTSILFEIADRYYFFDAGENCSFAASEVGVDFKRVRAIFISHMHIDHIGGLANLLFTIKKIELMTKSEHAFGNSFDIFVPDLEKLESVKDVAGARYSASNCTEHLISDGVIFDDGILRVTAMHNTHLKENGDNGWHSYSFLIEAEGKKIVFSGDVGYPEELDPLTAGGCDALIMETGHHKVARVLAYANARGAKKLLFTHHGREILADPAAAARAPAAAHPDATVCRDGDAFFL